MWEYGNTGEYAPTYYLQTDAPLYYYSFTDAAIAMAYKSLPAEQQARLDPMITGFNPAELPMPHYRLPELNRSSDVDCEIFRVPVLQLERTCPVH
jgi:hypothetical protein